MKDGKCETLVVISLLVAPKPSHSVYAAVST